MKYLVITLGLGLLSACQDHTQDGSPSAHAFASADATHHAAAHDSAHDAHASSQGASSAPAPAGSNPVQNEMQLLTTALEATVRGIGLGDVRGVEHELHRVHQAKQATEAALESGSYKPPKNGDQLARFHTLDEAFHADLARLVEASRNNDVPATAVALGSALQQCNGCHSEFRP